MGLWSFVAGICVTFATMSFVDGMLMLESFPFPVVVPYLLSMLGFGLVALVNPRMLAGGGGGGLGGHDDLEVTNTYLAGSGSSSDPFAQVRHKGSFVLGTMLMMLSTAVAVTLNAIGDGSTGCARGDGSASGPHHWPGFSLVFQGWWWLMASLALFIDKALVGSNDSIGGILSSGRRGDDGLQ